MSNQRKRLVLMAVCGLPILLFLALLWWRDPDAPRFEKTQSAASVVPFDFIHYDFLSSKPFANGGMWIQSAKGTSHETYVYNIEDRRIVGRLTNGSPVTLIGKQHLLCFSTRFDTHVLTSGLSKFLTRITRGRIRIPPPPSPPQRYWLLNLENNSASMMGELPGRPNGTFQTSPDFHYGYTSFSRGLEYDVYIFDFTKRSVSKVEMSGWAAGWWESQNIVIHATNNDLVLHNVPTGKITPFISSKQVATFLQDNMITEDPTKARSFFMWNGQENEFYITDTYKRWLATESYLIKVERPDAKLKLLANRFKFEWSDHIDPTGRYYLYTGRTAGKSSDGVFLRDLKNNIDHAVVMPMNDQYMSIPNFYGDSIVYIRSNNLWRVNFDGTHNVRLFPP